MGNEVIGSLQWEDEGGELIEAHLDGLRLVFEMMPQDVFEGGLKETFCLQFIDPYGDTTFNQLQIPVLISELKSLLRTEHCQKHQKLQEFEGLISFIEKARDQVHTYIKFYGD
jgi:hypothetical protein